MLFSQILTAALSFSVISASPVGTSSLQAEHGPEVIARGPLASLCHQFADTAGQVRNNVPPIWGGQQDRLGDLLLQVDRGAETARQACLHIDAGF
ncbi:hypothetical protein SAPIO_CDS6616 [Scedosporium apiospermum]|uniref:Uncharacterized protein n=1 Tax=Pseudallescheria apiosperma TaxID=563466 RepID=A0A084G3K3_PSEDA|nr:uncharacterized protein SAPIO_CDS6616 [Scedosporium apiospermum]KEZ41915.1 hypothetical protein SAPIO_CDS6616 [Scedosporium apiospermum]